MPFFGEQRQQGEWSSRFSSSSLRLAAFVCGGFLLLILIGAVLLFSAPPSFTVMSFVAISHTPTTTPSVLATPTTTSNADGSGQTFSDGSRSFNWPVGDCTYWANDRYHALSGHWVAWTGYPRLWVVGARAAGWNISQKPHIPSIMVLMPYVQGAGANGSVGVVESIVSHSTPMVVQTSNMAWSANGGGWNIVSSNDFNVGAGVYFIWR